MTKLTDEELLAEEAKLLDGSNDNGVYPDDGEQPPAPDGLEDEEDPDSDAIFAEAGLELP